MAYPYVPIIIITINNILLHVRRTQLRHYVMQLLSIYFLIRTFYLYVIDIKIISYINVWTKFSVLPLCITRQLVTIINAVALKT